MELKNVKEIVLYSDDIGNNNKLNDLAKYFGYKSFKEIGCRMDINFIKFIKTELSSDKNNSFSKHIEVKKIDTDKKWTIIYNRDEVGRVFKENIAYINCYQQEYNHIHLGI